MAKKDEILDPVVVAALIEQPDEDEEDKKLREDLSKLDEFADNEDDDSEDDKSEEDEDKSDKKMINLKKMTKNKFKIKILENL
jgi:hypothetical protein